MIQPLTCLHACRFFRNCKDDDRLNLHNFTLGTSSFCKINRLYIILIIKDLCCKAVRDSAMDFKVMGSKPGSLKTKIVKVLQCKIV